MIIKMAKYLICGSKVEVDHFLSKVQEAGILEFILDGKGSLKPVSSALNSQSEKLIAAIKELKRYVQREPIYSRGGLDEALVIAGEILGLKEEIQKLSEEKKMLTAEMVRIAPFGSFSMEDLVYIEKEGKRRIRFFCQRSSQEKGETPSDYIYIDTVYDLDYFITIGDPKKMVSSMIEMRIDLGLEELSKRNQLVSLLKEKHEQEMKLRVGYLEFLQEELKGLFDEISFIAAKKTVHFSLEEKLFFAEAWVPVKEKAKLFNMTHDLPIYLEEILIEKEDRVPTYLENQGVGKLGEDLVKIYDVPAVTDRDPSPWVFFFFSIFFALIVADGGYGAIFLAVALFCRKKFKNLQQEAKRMLRLFTHLSVACVLWGVLSCSYFGIKIAPTSFVSQISPLHWLAKEKAEFHFAQKDDVYQEWLLREPALVTAKSGQEMLSGIVECKKGVSCYPMFEEFIGNILMELTIVVAIVHLSLGLLRYLRRNIAGIGWISFMVGGYLFFPILLSATTTVNFLGLISKELAEPIGLQLLWGGLIFAMAAALIQKGWKGLAEITNLVQVFADVLSYLRLYALSLASSIMASTFNIEGQALGLVAGALVILAGHGVNIVIALQGGVIHGLRLNFLEWYHYCFDGGGKLFRPFIKLKTHLKGNRL